MYICLSVLGFNSAVHAHALCDRKWEGTIAHKTVNFQLKDTMSHRLHSWFIYGGVLMWGIKRAIFSTMCNTRNCHTHTRSGWGMAFSTSVERWLKNHHAIYTLYKRVRSRKTKLVKKKLSVVVVRGNLNCRTGTVMYHIVGNFHMMKIFTLAFKSKNKSHEERMGQDTCWAEKLMMSCITCSMYLFMFGNCTWTHGSTKAVEMAWQRDHVLFLKNKHSLLRSRDWSGGYKEQPLERTHAGIFDGWPRHTMYE